jgi:hypothetical protein
MRPSLQAVNATLELRRWTRRQQEATGRPVEQETLRDRAYRLYKLRGSDLEYAVDCACVSMPCYAKVTD